MQVTKFGNCYMELNTRHNMYLREYVLNKESFSLSCAILRDMIRADSSTFGNKDRFCELSWLSLLKQTSLASISIPINMECYQETFSWNYHSGDRSGVLTCPFPAIYFFQWTQLSRYLHIFYPTPRSRSVLWNTG